MRSIKIITIFLLVISATAYAQKLPKVQEASLRAPDNIKIDGKPTEWSNQFQAYNSSTDIYYTIANDDNNLYLVVQVIPESYNDEMLINKILRGGLTLAIQKTGKKDDKNTIAITYPVSNYAFSLRLRDYKSGKIVDTASVQTASARVEKNNKLIEQQIKYIGVKGISGVDSLISIYNENNIKAAGLLDFNKGYTLELSLPLKYLDLSAVDEPKFAYHIILNGYKRPPTMGSPTNMDGTPATGPAVDRMMAIFAQMDATASARTDFWGEYTLAKN